MRLGLVLFLVVGFATAAYTAEEKALSVVGTWEGKISSGAGSADVTLRLEQDGSQVRGT